MDGVYLITSLTFLICWAFVLSYIFRLEKIGCACSANWRRDFIKYYLMIIIALILLRLIFNVSFMDPVLMVIKFGFMIAFAVIVFEYIHDLKRKKCECSEHVARDVLEIINYIQIIIGVMILIQILYLAHVVGKAMKSSKFNKELEQYFRKSISRAKH